MDNGEINSNDYNSDPEKLYMITNLDVIAECLRKEGIKEFNLRYSEDCMTLTPGKYAKTGRKRKWTKQGLETIIPIVKVVEIIKESLPYLEEEGKYCINGRYFAMTVERITKSIFYSVCNKLVDAGVLQLIFNSEKNDFAYKVIEKPKER